MKIFSTFVLSLLLSINMLAQDGSAIEVKGTVNDNFGPVIGANVLIKGTSTGVTTDLNGNFSLKAPESSTLVISYVGYKTQEVAVSSNLVILLVEDSELLDEVVVIGYGSVKKTDLTGSVTTVKADELNRGMASSTTDLLVGKAAGVNVVSAGGAPGAGASVRIRGGSSMSANNEPLYIIDGVPIDSRGVSGMSNPLSTINANDIESFTVLKDASATAIYGSRASNGVILITTKSGKAGKVRVSYDGSVSVATKTETMDVMNANAFKQFVIDKHGADSKQALALGNADTNWQDQIFKTAVSTDHNVSVAGATKVLPYRVSFGYTNENGILKTSWMERSTVALNLNPKFFEDMLSIQFNIKGMYMRNRFADTGAVGSAAEFDPTQPIYSDSPYGNGYYMSLKEDGKPIDIALANPLAILQQKYDKSDVKRSIGNLQIDYKLHWLPELRANLNLAYDFSRSFGRVNIVDNSPMSYTQGDNKAGWGENRTYTQYKRNQLMDFYLNYNKTFNSKHHLDVMAGYSWQYFAQEDFNSYPLSIYGQSQKGGALSYKDSDSKKLDNQLISVFGRLNYSFDSRYLFTATLRNDGSSRFSKDNRWGLFPSVALAWRASEEGFMKNQKVVSDLKLRLGYGVTGQQDIGYDFNMLYGYMPFYSYSKAGASYYWGDTQYQLTRPSAYNPDLKWEETTTYNIGLDYGFVGNRIRGGLDVYYRKTKDMLFMESISAGSNFSNELITNRGKMTNKGVEFTLTANAIETKDLNWTINYNIAYNKNEVTNLGDNASDSFRGIVHGGITGGTGNRVLIHQVGQPYNSFYVYQQIYDSNGKPIEGAYVDQNEDGVLDEDDLIAYKTSAPNVTMGLSSQLTYKNWDFSFAMHASLNNYVYNNIQSNREAYGGSQMYDPSGFLKNRLNSAINTDFANPQFLSSYYVQKASFLRMDNITLGYNFKSPVKFLEAARVYFTVSNPFVITSYDGIDPEFSGSSTDGTEGIDNNIFPRPRTYMLGLNLKF